MVLSFLHRSDDRNDGTEELPSNDDIVDVTAPILDAGENVVGVAERG